MPAPSSRPIAPRTFVRPAPNPLSGNTGFYNQVRNALGIPTISNQASRTKSTWDPNFSELGVSDSISAKVTRRQPSTFDKPGRTITNPRPRGRNFTEWKRPLSPQELALRDSIRLSLMHTNKGYFRDNVDVTDSTEVKVKPWFRRIPIPPLGEPDTVTNTGDSGCKIVTYNGRRYHVCHAKSNQAYRRQKRKKQYASGYA